MKVTEQQFEEALRNSGGLYSQTVKYIKKHFDVTISRAGVKDRADKKPELLQEIRNTVIDKAEAGMITLMNSKNEGIKFKTCTYMLDRLGSDRGYINKSNVDHTTKGEKIEGSQTIITKEEIKQINSQLEDDC